MKILTATAAVAIFSITALTPSSLTKTDRAATHAAKEQKIQVAILLDVSGSMEGLIEQAKAQLWNMVNVMGRSKCENGNPKIEIALYEYGRSTNDSKAGYVKQISGFTSDLDLLSQELFKLTTNGGDEYCGHVIHTSLGELNWDTVALSYKVIFIAGNEDFLQGNIHYTQSCAEAKKKGVIVNTIYCGDKMQGIREHWNLGGECGNGSFTNINQDAKIEEIPTPYDSTLVVLNYKLNGTYLYYGANGYSDFNKQGEVDKMNSAMSKSAGLKRATAKSNSLLYQNAGWDLIDATKNDSTGNFISTLDKKTLPDSLKNKSKEELQKVIDKKAAERSAIQKEIINLSTQRNAYIVTERAKNATAAKTATLETEVEKIIKEQVKRFNMKVD
ncbi:MAG TPA: vWA domain-containing protein [Chitinophagaceae bacterium]|nr:vWA domain-containing protein [Chitinophagaceae bacterium]